jgi:hypothetical protein
VNWNFDPRAWKTSTKVLLGLITLWPVIYIGLFVVLIFSGVLFGALLSDRSQAPGTDIDLIQLEKKIQGGEIKELRIRRSEIEAFDLNGRSFEPSVSNDSTRDEIIRQARQLDANQHPRVSKIDENDSERPVNAIVPIGFAVFFLCHMLTIFLMLVLMPLYIILAVKDERHDQTTRIIWVVLMATMGMLADPVYWYLYVWRKSPPNMAPRSNPL